MTAASDVPELDPTAAEALASILLARVADALSDDPTLMGTAVTGMADDTGLALDVCAALLLACSTIMGAGEVPAEVVFAASVALDPTAETADSAGREWVFSVGDDHVLRYHVETDTAP